jgi:hypothetical protein
VSVVCVVICAIVVAIGSVLLNPTPLASGELSFPIRPPGPTLTYGPGVNSLALGHSMVTPNAPTTPTTQTGGGGSQPPTRPPVATSGGFCSFTPTTPVATAHGEQPIGKLHVGEQVEAYNPKTHKMELEPIEHVWIHTDHDLVDLTLTITAHAPHSSALIRTSEIVHTNKKHPFFTEEKGFVPVAQLKLGMHVLRANGQYGLITGWRIVPGAKVMYNLTVSQDHTFTVGLDQWVVHNCNPEDLVNSQARSAALKTRNAFIDHLNPLDLQGAWNDAQGNPIPKGPNAFWDHEAEVNTAFRSGRNTLALFRVLLEQGGLSEEDQCIVQCLFGRISRTMDYAENIINRPTWTQGANVLDWWSP